VQAVQEHPELSIGSRTSTSDHLLSVGNTQTLQDSAVIEAFNLKCAIELQLKNESAAKEALQDMPPRETKDLDACTLHNKALVSMADDPEEGFRTLNFLINNPPFPPEAFANLLLLYIKPPHNLYDFAADTIAQHPEHVQRYLQRDLLMFLDAVTMKQSSPHDACQQLEQLAKQHIEKLRLQMKLLQV
jgi:tetratricopeptide repeat protein 30